jgi:hypothetical protein
VCLPSQSVFAIFFTGFAWKSSLFCSFSSLPELNMIVSLLVERSLILSPTSFTMPPLPSSLLVPPASSTITKSVKRFTTWLLLGSFVFCRDNFFFHATRHMLCNAVFYTSRSLLELVIEDPTLTNNEEPNPSPFGRCLKYCSNADVLSIVQSTKLTPK